MTINWRDSFSVEDPIIDEDHKTLINYFNKFEWVTEGDLDLNALKHIFLDIRKHAVEHFKREEDLMVSINYPGIDEHKKSHRNIMAKLDEVLKRVNSGDSEEPDDGKIVRDMVILLNNWLNDHVIGEDQLYKPYIVKQRTYENKGNGASDARRASDAAVPAGARRASDAAAPNGARRASDAAAPPGARRASDTSGDRRATASGVHLSPAWRIVLVVTLVLAVAAVGGAYWLYGDIKDMKSPVADATKPANTNKLPASVSPVPSGLEWVANSKCDKLPNVDWWSNSSHLKIARYVSIKHSGDWTPYIKKWSKQLKKLKKIRANGVAAMAPGGVRLEGSDLDVYIKDVSDRVDIIKCLAEEAIAYAAR